MKTGSLVVRHRAPWQERLFQIALVVIAILVGWGLYRLGLHNAGFSSSDASQVQERMEKMIENLQQDKITLRDQLALVEQSSQVDAQAYQQVKDNLKALQEEILELREEVSFYRGIVAPMESSAGLRVDRFNVEKVSEQGLYHYSMVLTQVLKNDQMVRGVARFVIEGIQNDRPKSFELEEVSASNDKQLEFKFRYFQKFEGDVLLPTNFIPRRVVIDVTPHRRKNFTSSYDWPQSEKLPEPMTNG